MSKIVVIDGNSIMNRAFYGISGRNMLMTKSGIHTNAVFGFLTILFKILNEDKPDHLAVAFDLKAPTFRHKMYTGYKAQRKGMPEELFEQMPIIKEVLDAMNIIRVELEGFEADDILGTLAEKASNKGEEVILFTGDRDSFQLIKDGVLVKLPSTKGGKTETETYDVSKIKEKYGVTPLELIDVKGLMGDASDNIPGVPGIGEKTALGYIQEFHNIDNLYENLDNPIIKPKAKEALNEFKDLAFLSRILATIKKDIPVEFDEEQYRIKEVNNEKLFELFTKLEFTTFIKKLNLVGDVKTSDFEFAEGKKINTTDEVQNLSEFAFFPFWGDAVQVGIYSGNTCFCVDIDNDELLKNVFECPAKKYGFNTKDTYIELKKRNIELKNLVFDMQIAQYIVDSTRVSDTIEKVASTDLGVDFSGIKEENKDQISFFDAPKKADNNKYVCSAARVIWELKDGYINKIKDNKQEQLFNDIEMPLIEVLADMQIIGMKVDRNRLHEYGAELQTKIDLLTKEIIELAGEEFNINSPKQLGDILFEKLKLSAGKKTQTGYATDADTLDRIKDSHPIIGKILEYKQYIKLKSTYIDGLETVINSETGRIHSSFNQTITATGRLSSTEPNLQNIPARMDAGKKIRGMFVPEEGFSYIDADYSQIELRVLAHMAKDRVILEAFNNDEDIHTATASQIFHMPKTEVTSALRSRAKTVNFGIVYGQSEFSLGQDLGISRREAKDYIDTYFEHFSGIKAFMDGSIKFGKEFGYVQTVFNRRRYLPEISSSNFNVRSFGERIAMNMPIQGSAADIIKIAMISVYNRLKGMKSKLILQVHDELIVEASNDEVDEVKRIVRESMENAVKLNVLLKVDLNVGGSWLEAK